MLRLFWRQSVLGFALLATLAGCSRLEPPGPSQPLVVGLPADPVFQQAAPSSEGMDGFSRDLIEAFAASLGVKVRYVVAADYPALMDMVRQRRVHVAATVPVSALRAEVLYSPPVHESRQLIVQQASALPVGRVENLAGREIVVMPGAPQAQVLRALALDPPVAIGVPPVTDEIEMIAAASRRRHVLVATDELHFNVAANFHPEIDVALELPEKIAYAWAFAVESRRLRDQAADFIATARQNGTLHRINDRYFGHIRRLNTRDIQTFLERLRDRLADFRHAFQEAQEITGIDWRWLAALSYQESKWDPLATSHTNVRGMMMLTEDTADRLKVSNRLDAKQSILAGAKYLATLMDDLPENIKQPDRLWFALAAYNLGMGHLNGARHFAPGLKLDPNVWVDMKQVMPLMARPEYYTRLKSGRARGGEAVIMVENIRNYFDVLSRFEPVYVPPSMGDTAAYRKVVKRKSSSKTGAAKRSAQRR